MAVSEFLDTIKNKSISERKEAFVEFFAKHSQWEDKYKTIIEIGKSLPQLPDELKTEESKIKGCQSQVWLHAELKDHKVYFTADSDALLVRGLVAVLIAVYSGIEPSQVKLDDGSFLIKMGFEKNLSPSRTNGLNAMLKQIRNFAIAFEYQLNLQK